MLFNLDSILSEPSAPPGGTADVSSTIIGLLHQLRDLGLKAGAYTTTSDCEELLRTTGLGDLFAVHAAGTVATSRDDTGPTDPAALLDLAQRLGARPERCVVLDGACATIEAARAGGFALIVGITPSGDGADQLAAGADVVVGDPDDIEIRTGDLRVSALPHALGSIAQIESVLGGRSPAFFLDFDGTVSEIVDDPAAATPADGVTEALGALSGACPVAVVSGRALSDIRARVGLDGLWYAGTHGTELLSPDGELYRHPMADESIRLLRNAVDDLTPALSAIDGVAIEDKQLSVAVHFRLAAPDRVPEVIAAVRSAGRRHDLGVTHGRKVIELRPPGKWDKGDAINWIIDHLDTPDPILPLYLGDDLTDEDAFDAITHNGLGVLVRHGEDGDRCSAADFAVNTPREATQLLKQLAAQLAPTPPTHTDGWVLIYDGYQPEAERLREVLCAVGNGYLVTRAAAPEAQRGAAHYPGTYAAGVYNRLTDVIGEVSISNESLVNLPNWLPLTFRIDNGPWFDIDDADVLSYRQVMNIRQAECVRELRFRDSAGRCTSVTQRRFASMNDPHVCALQTTVVAENWSGTIDIRSTIDATVTNCGVSRYESLSGQHLGDIRVSEVGEGAVLVDALTVQSRLPIAVATHTSVWCGEQPAATTHRFRDHADSAGHDITTDVIAGQPLTVDKVAVVFTGHDRAISVPSEAASNLLSELGRYSELFADHRAMWLQLWRKFDFSIGGSAEPDQKILRLHIMHLLQSVSSYTADLDAGAPARGLHGEAYRGHIFWDAMFIAPLLTLRVPQISRSLLGYRSRRLPQARRSARAAGYAGAMFPWQSGSDGREESQQMHLNPMSGRWRVDSSHLAHHIGTAVAYNVWQYYQITGDRQYLIDQGAEMLVEIARFWVSRARYDSDRGRYVIDGVIGPDEFHSGYPDRPDDGVDNNAYTNVMAVWVILRALEVLQKLPLPDRLDLLDRLGVSRAELTQWDSVSRRMYVPFHDGVISQFEGYDDLEELDWAAYRTRYPDISRLDRILEAENDDINRYKASKQADVLMLFYLLSADELRELLTHLGYRFRPQQIPRTIDYYSARTSHGSTLSAIVHAWVSARGNREQALQYFRQVLRSDVADVQGGSTAEGIHLAAMAGSIDLLQRCFTGLETRGDRLVLGPMWPRSAGQLRCSLWYRGHRLHLVISGRTAEVIADPTGAPPIEVECRGRTHSLASGQSIRIK
ncbi:trehalose-phosphatase [Mycolicibacterium psychrotolerans]|uniref:trehalose-phosphatase n=1 Tax=Mycolicibacterium psychrotolerans TaxID=216929 RepID=UPI003D6799B3